MFVQTAAAEVMVVTAPYAVITLAIVSTAVERYQRQNRTNTMVATVTTVPTAPAKMDGATSAVAITRAAAALVSDNSTCSSGSNSTT